MSHSVRDVVIQRVKLRSHLFLRCVRALVIIVLSRASHGYIAQWLERLAADQQVPGSNPGVPSFVMSWAPALR